MIRLLQRTTGACSTPILEEALTLLNDQPEVLDQVEAKRSCWSSTPEPAATPSAAAGWRSAWRTWPTAWSRRPAG